jgi:tRNA (adenine22-N1)-methyltransferase
VDNIKLSRRLLAVANFVRDKAVVADIGTDHAYLPAYLVKSGKVDLAVASDINEGPLKKAAETVQKYNLEQNVKLVLSNGLNDVDLNDITDIVIAGMGGELICQIIDNCNELLDSSKNLILQPMTNAAAVRQYLYQKGFKILKEAAVIDDKYTYCIIRSCYYGKSAQTSKFFEYIGKISENTDDESKEYLRRQYIRVMNIAKGLECSKNKKSEALEYYEIAKRISEIINAD